MSIRVTAKTVEELVDIGAGIGRPVVERTTTYERR
jgi:FO synthase